MQRCNHLNHGNYIYLKVYTIQTKHIHNLYLLAIFFSLAICAIGCNIELGDPVITPTAPNGKIPTISTNEVISISRTTANCGGNVTNQGSSYIYAKGVCWDTRQNPIALITINTTVDGGGVGEFTSSISGLISNTTYYVRAYATNQTGTAYGEERSFKTQPLPKISGEGVTDIENNFYPTVIIDSMEWMARNLMTTKLNDGTPIQNITDSIKWSNSTTSAYCWLLNNEKAYKEKYGALYNFYVVESEKICPVDWHVPTLLEWTKLIDYLGGVSYAPEKLKQKDHDIPVLMGDGYVITNWDGSNEVGFTALASGMRTQGGIFNGGQVIEARSAQYWTSSLDDISDFNYKWSILLSAYITKTNWDGRSGFSVRCVKNK